MLVAAQFMFTTLLLHSWNEQLQQHTGATQSSFATAGSLLAAVAFKISLTFPGGQQLDVLKVFIRNLSAKQIVLTADIEALSPESPDFSISKGLSSEHCWSAVF